MPDRSGSAPRILIVEDNPQTRDALSAVLSLHGYEVVRARNGAEGVRAALELHPHLILMDLTMPELDGLAAARRLREDSRWPQVPILAVSADYLPSERARAVDEVFDAHLVKPVLVRTLLESVAAHLEAAETRAPPRWPRGGG